MSAEHDDEMTSNDWELEHACQAALECAKRIGATKGAIIILNDEGFRYETQFFNVGMKLSELVSLVEVIKAEMVEMIRGERVERNED